MGQNNYTILLKLNLGPPTNPGGLQWSFQKGVKGKMCSQKKKKKEKLQNSSRHIIDIIIGTSCIRKGRAIEKGHL